MGLDTYAARSPEGNLRKDDEQAFDPLTAPPLHTM
jgi:hypothetical protein